MKRKTNLIRNVRIRISSKSRDEITVESSEGTNRVLSELGWSWVVLKEWDLKDGTSKRSTVNSTDPWLGGFW